MATLTFLDWTIFVGYLAVVFAMGLWFAREQHTNEDYFVAGRKMHWLPVGLSMFAGTFSSLSFVGLPREAAYEDYHLYLAILFIPFVVTPIVWQWFIPLYHRLGLVSAYAYLDARFNRRVRLSASLLYALYATGWMGNLLLAVGVILQAVLGLSQGQLIGTLVGVGVFATIYTAAGGVKAVIWTDVLQAFALGGGMLAVLALTLAKVDGGLGAVWQLGMEHDKFAMFRMEWNFERGNFPAACAFGIFVYLSGHATGFTAVQRYVSMPTIAAARQSLIVNGAMVAIVCLLFFMVGSTLFAYYIQNPPDQVDKGTPFPAKFHEKNDQLLPSFVASHIRVAGLMGLILAGLFAAAMSSIDSGINSLTATVVCDWLPGQRLGLRFSRVLCAGFGLGAILVAVVLLFLKGNVFEWIMRISGTFLGPLLGVFLLGMLVRRANATGALLGIAAGLVSIVGALFATGGELSHWWFGAVTCIPTFVVGVAASFFFAPPRAEQLDGLMVVGQGKVQ